MIINHCKNTDFLEKTLEIGIRYSVISIQYGKSHAISFFADEVKFYHKGTQRLTQRKTKEYLLIVCFLMKPLWGLWESFIHHVSIDETSPRF
jgi:hypothetical protein